MRIPNHVAIIPDGNRRWAQGSGLAKKEGYGQGLAPGLQCLHLAREVGVREITYYGFTTDNCKRPAAEVKAFTKACVKAVDLIAREGADLLVVGNTDSQMFPKELLPYTGERMHICGGGIRVNFLVNYGWEWDMSAMQTQNRSRQAITGNLRSHEVSRIDLIVRWGGRKRLSGLLPVQAVYADLYTLDELWPDFSPEQFSRALSWYDTQDVTLGG